MYVCYCEYQKKYLQIWWDKYLRSQKTSEGFCVHCHLCFGTVIYSTIWCLGFYVCFFVFVFFFIAENCSGYCTCAHCLEQPGCGWCTDPSNTGKGKCIEGSYRGPVKMPTPSATGKHSLEPVLNVSMCSVENNYNWSFIQCPGKRAMFNCWNFSAIATIKCKGRDLLRL